MSQLPLNIPDAEVLNRFSEADFLALQDVIRPFLRVAQHGFQFRALLCQMGFSSRVGALWVTRQLAASFKENQGLREWLRENDAILEDSEFWESDDHYLLWRHTAAPSGAEYPRPWNHKSYKVTVKWSVPVPRHGTLIRIIPGSGRDATVCGTDLSPLGTVQLPFNPHGVSLDGNIVSSGQVAVNYFGSA